MNVSTLPHRTPRRQRGAAALIVTLMLFFAMVLVAVFANRNLLLEQRSAANQYRSTQAFEAAEAGIEWALAQLNSGQRIGAACLPSADPNASSFRTRYLGFTRSSAMFTPTTWNFSGTATALHPTCVRSATGWSCSCPAQGAPLLTAPAGAATAPAFSLQFLPTAKPGLVRVTATGCTRLAGACLPGSSTNAEATAKVEVALGLLAAVRTPPAATFTLRGGFDADGAALGVHNPDPASGIAIHAGAQIAASHARLTVPAGASKAGARVGNDSALAGLSADRFFAAHFGVDKAGWKAQPAVTRIACSGDCSAALMAAANTAADTALVSIDGDLTLTGPITLGSVQHPVLLVVSGAVRFDGAVAISGVVYGASVSWNHTAGGAFVRGALLSEAGYQGDGTPELFYDTAVLDTLKGQAGSFARVNGSWRDF